MPEFPTPALPMHLSPSMRELPCRPQHVLLVEPDLAAARELQLALEARGHVVQSVTDARRAIELPAPDALIAAVDEDAGFGGFELLETFQGRAFRPRALFLTTTPVLESCRRALRLGAVDYLTRPIPATQVVDAIESGHESAGRQEPGLQLRLVSGPGTEERAARRVGAFCLERGIGPTCRARIGTALCEIVSNAVRHAYPATPGPIEIAARLERRRLLVGVRDFGLGFESEGLGSHWLGGSLGSALDGGLARVACLSEDFVVQSRPGAGTFVQVGFSVQRVLFDEEPPRVDLCEHDFLTSETAASVLEAIGLERRDSSFHLSPALAVTVGRMLAGPDPRRVLQTAFRS